MSQEKRPEFDYERHGKPRVGNLVRDRGIPWSEQRERQNRSIDTAWNEWLATERERRGNPTWQPF